MKPIGKNTPVTIGLVATLAGGIGWLTDIKVQGSANANALSEVKAENLASQRAIRRMEKWLAAIGQKLNVPEPRE